MFHLLHDCFFLSSQVIISYIFAFFNMFALFVCLFGFVSLSVLTVSKLIMANV